MSKTASSHPARDESSIDVEWTECGMLVRGMPTGRTAPDVVAACFSAVLHDVVTAQELVELIEEVGPAAAMRRFVAAGVTPLHWTRVA